MRVRSLGAGWTTGRLGRGDGGRPGARGRALGSMPVKVAEPAAVESRVAGALPGRGRGRRGARRGRSRRGERSASARSRSTPSGACGSTASRYEMKGACVHHDNGPLGAAAIDRAEERRVELLKAAGFNAIRTSHNPPSPAFLDACDRLGHAGDRRGLRHLGAAEEPRTTTHRSFEDWWARDLAAMVRRDRNHPSVVIWSIGNEVNERADPSGLEIARRLIAGRARRRRHAAGDERDLRLLGPQGPRVDRHRPGLRAPRRGRLQLPVEGVRERPRPGAAAGHGRRPSRPPSRRSTTGARSSGCLT